MRVKEQVNNREAAEPIAPIVKTEVGTKMEMNNELVRSLKGEFTKSEKVDLLLLFLKTQEQPSVEVVETASKLVDELFFRECTDVDMVKALKVMELL